MNPSIQKLGVVIRPESPEITNACMEIFNILRRFNIEFYIEKDSSIMLNIPEQGIVFDEMIQKVQALLTIGGDGTLIATVRRNLEKKLPVFGINMGKVGFLTAINPSELESFIPLLLQGQYKLESHKLIEARFASNMNNVFYALNEILITKKGMSGMIKIHAKIDNDFFNTYRADGLIIATPTGSSAYNISAGGSIVHPHCKTILLTPVCAHSITQRPMVLSDELHMDFMTESDGVIMIDGQEYAYFNKDDILHVSSSMRINLIQHPNHNYFAVLKEKFHWGDKD